MESPFYIDSSVPFLALGITYLLTKIKNKKTRRTTMILYLFAAAAFFIYYFPLNFWR